MTLSRCGDTGSVLDLPGENMVLGNTRAKSQTYRLLLGLYVCCCECIFAITLESQFKIYHMESLVPSNPLLNRWHRQCGITHLFLLSSRVCVALETQHYSGGYLFYQFRVVKLFEIS